MKFPLFIDISDKKILVVGAGKIGSRRIRVLLEFGGKVTVVSDKTDINCPVENVSLINRKFKESDIEDYFLVIASTNDRAVNHRIYEICREKNIPVSVADSAEESTFYFPAICVNESLCIGIVSEGSQHSLVKKTAKKIRSDFLCQ